MKQGRSIQELAMEIQRQTDSKRDFHADTRKMVMTPEAKIELEGVDTFKVRDYAHSQIATRVGIPKPYYDKMKNDAPNLLANNVNHWFGKDPEVRLVRTLDGDMRAFLSEKYRTLDNFDLMETALPVLMENKCDIVSCDVTEHRLYLKALFPKIQMEVKRNDVVQAGIVISNSEVGAGSLRVEPLTYRLVCLNGMIAAQAMRKYHVGKARGTFEDVQELLTDKTREVSDAAFWMQVRDVVQGSIRKDIFEGNVQKMIEATDKQIVSKDVPAVVEAVRKNFGLNKDQSNSVLTHLIKDGDLTMWGLANAVTRTANDEEDYEAATHLEKMGGKIIELSPKDWKTISTSAAS